MIYFLPIGIPFILIVIGVQLVLISIIIEGVKSETQFILGLVGVAFTIIGILI